MRSLETVVLFATVGAVALFLAFFVDFIAQSALDEEVRAVAKAAGDSVASVLRDVYTVSSWSYVASFERFLYLPTDFPTLDAFDYTITLFNYRGVLYVNISFTGYRGSGVSHVVYTVAVGNFTELGHGSNIQVLIDDSEGCWMGIDLTWPESRVELKPRREPYVLCVRRVQYFVT
ncbi:MAG: hypothetical protein QW610_05620 [Pyrobaculum sp.]